MRFPARTVIVATFVGLSFAGVSSGQSRPADKPTSEPAKSAPLADMTQPPTLWVSTNEWNFGEIWYGDPAEAEIEIRNVGGGVLRIQNVNTSCGCTVAQPSKHELASNESDKIKLTYNTKKGVQSVNQEVTINSNDAKMPAAKVRVRGIVKNYFSCTNVGNASIIFGQTISDAADTMTMELTNNLPEKVKPELVPLPEGSRFDVKLETVEEGSRYKLIVTTKPPMPMGPNVATITLKTGLERWPEQKFPVNANVTDRVSVVPPVIQVMKTNQHVARRVANISFLKDKPLKVKEVKVSNPAVTAKLLDQRPSPQAGGRFMAIPLELSVPTWEQFPREGVTVTIETEDEDPRFKSLQLRINRAPDFSQPQTTTRPIARPAAPLKPTSQPTNAPQPAKP